MIMTSAATPKRATAKQLREMITDLACLVECSGLVELETMVEWSESEREWQGYSPEQYADEVAELAGRLPEAHDGGRLPEAHDTRGHDHVQRD
jgi:hypothetical protein